MHSRFTSLHFIKGWSALSLVLEKKHIILTQTILQMVFQINEKKFHCLYLFIHINSLLVNFSAKGKMNWISRSQSMGRWTLSPLRQFRVKRGSVDLEVCEILLSISVMSSTTHFSVIKAEKFYGKKLFPFVQSRFTQVIWSQRLFLLL